MHGGDTPLDVYEQIRQEVLSWEGVTEAEHEFGGIEFRLGKREIGHLHDDLKLADLPFPVRVREELVASGRAMPHHIFPKTGWVSYSFADENALPGAIELFRLAYDRAYAARERGEATAKTEGGAEAIDA
jgi:Family of unknown function (DUF5519)